MLKAVMRTGDTLVHGVANGADKLAAAWARENGYKEDPHPVTDAIYEKHGKVAPNLRNQEMVDSGIDLLVVFFDG